MLEIVSVGNLGKRKTSLSSREISKMGSTERQMVWNAILRFFLISLMITCALKVAGCALKVAGENMDEINQLDDFYVTTPEAMHSSIDMHCTAMRSQTRELLQEIQSSIDGPSTANNMDGNSTATRYQSRKLLQDPIRGGGGIVKTVLTVAKYLFFALGGLCICILFPYCCMKKQWCCGNPRQRQGPTEKNKNAISLRPITTAGDSTSKVRSFSTNDDRNDTSPGHDTSTTAAGVAEPPTSDGRDTRTTDEDAKIDNSSGHDGSRATVRNAEHPTNNARDNIAPKDYSMQSRIASVK